MIVSLQEYLESERRIEKKTLSKLIPPGPNVNWPNVCFGFLLSNIAFGIGNIFIDQDLSLARQRFYLCGRFIATGIERYNSRIFDFGIPQLCYALLSDNASLLERLANLGYKGDGKNYPDMEIMVAEGEPAIFCNSIQQVIKGDWAGLARNLPIMEKVTLPKGDEVMRIDLEFFKAILNKDKARIEEVVNLLLTPENHLARNDDPLHNQYISMPALGYAKLAWMHGLEVEIDHPLVPKDLLPIRPLERYDDTYEFWSLMS